MEVPQYSIAYGKKIMRTFEDVFADAKKRLDRALQGNASEQYHIQRCLTLAETIEWNHSNVGNEFGEMLRAKGILLFDKIIQRITSLLRDETTPELRNHRKFMHHLMFVHDLGKYNPHTHTYDGTNHEVRSANIVAENQETLQQELHWTKENVALLVHLTRYHGLLGITRIGEASMVFLSPILDRLIGLSADRKHLFLDLLIVLTCCDAGASGDFTTKTFYLDDSRIALYDQLSHELFLISTNLMRRHHADASNALLAQASEFTNTAVRIKRIVTSNNLLTIPDDRIETVLHEMLSRRRLDATSFALTRFDHGAYVFAPLLTHLERGKKSISQDSLAKLLLLLGVLCGSENTRRVIQFRDSFSMKADLQTRNAQNFYELCDAVERGEPQKIADVLRKHKNSDMERSLIG
jgi:hypothetical protein